MGCSTFPRRFPSAFFRAASCSSLGAGKKRKRVRCLQPFRLRFPFLSRLPILIFRSRTTAAALLQSLALIHTSDPPPQTRCLLSHNAPQLQNFSQTHSAPLSTAHLSLPLEPPFLSAGLPARLFVVQFHLLCLFSFSNSLHFPFLRLHSASAFPTKVSPDLPRSPFDVKWRQRKRTNWRSSLRCWRAAVGPRVAFMRFYI